MTRLRGGGPEPNYDGADFSGKSVGDDKKSVEQGAVKDLRSERQRRLVAGADIRHLWGKERAERDIALLKLKKAQTALELMRAECAGKDAELARREEDMRVHLDQTQRLHKQMECMLRQESAEHVRDLGQKLKEELAVLQAAEKDWRAEWYRQASELADEKCTSLRLNSSLVAEK